VRHGRLTPFAASTANGRPDLEKAAHEPPLRRKTHWEGNFQDLCGVFEAGHHRDVPYSPPKAAKLTFPMSLGPDGGLPRGPVESRTKHHYVCSGCLIDRLGSGLRHGRLHRLTMEKVSCRGAQLPPAAANLRAQIRTRGLATTDLEGRPTASDLPSERRGVKYSKT
jgi:hypothetical protein